jgi:hypothetical protein
MMLMIRSASKSDFGSYKCVAKNALGETDGVIKLYGKLACRPVSFIEFTMSVKQTDSVKGMTHYFIYLV